MKKLIEVFNDEIFLANNKKYIHAEILPPLLLWVPIMDVRVCLSVRSNILHSEFPLRDVMRSKPKLNQGRKHEALTGPVA